MDTSKLGRCLTVIGHYSRALSILVVRGLDFVSPAHVGCVELVQGGLTGSDLVDAKPNMTPFLTG